MPEENRCEVEEGGTTRFFFVTIQKDDGEEEFTVERTYFPNQDTTEYCVYNLEGEELDPEEKEYKEISAVVSKYLERKGNAIEIDNDLLKDRLKFALGKEPREVELKAFREYVKIDIQQWIADNAKAFVDGVRE